MLTKKFVNLITEDMKKRNKVRHWTRKDLQRIVTARITGEWTEVYMSDLYNKYGGEYCSLLESIYKYKEEIEVV